MINVIDQSQKDTWVKLPSFVDLSRPILLVEHINYLRKLYTLLGTNSLHNVNSNLTRDTEQIEEAFQVSILYKRKIECTEEKIIRDLQNIWPIFKKVWPKYCNDKKLVHIKFFDHILSNYTISHEQICEMLSIFLAVAPTTWPFERSYSKLEKVF